MAGDPSNDRLRRIRCKDSLWEVFEQMAVDLDCSLDFLVAESMGAYAREQGYPWPPGNAASPDSGPRPPEDSLDVFPPAGPREPPHKAPAPAAASALTPAPPLPRRPPPPPSTVSNARQPLAPPPRSPAPPEGATTRPPTMDALRGPSAGARPVFPGLPPLPAPPAPAPSNLPAHATAPTAQLPPLPPLPAGPVPSAARGARSGGFPSPPLGQSAPITPPPPRGAHRSPLNVYYEGVRFPVDKEPFVIGRGKGVSDLVIKDPNVSRQHARIEWDQGYWYIVDMGSTNGIEEEGIRVQKKRIAEGDIVTICNHAIGFSFR